MTFFFNRRPYGADVCRTINEDTRYTVKAADFGFVDYDWGQSMSGVRIDTLAGGGRLLLNGMAVMAGQFITKADLDAGKLVFEPAANASGNNYANFTFSVRDSAGDYDACPNCFSLNVCPVNDAPDARDDNATTKAGTAITIDVKANDSDPDNTNAQLKVTQATLVDPTKGTVVVNADGTVTYKPAAGVTGIVEINYTIKDPGGLSDSAKVLVDVKADGTVKQCLLFDFNGNSALDGPDGNVRSYTVSGVSVKVTAFARADDTGAWSKAYVGAYGGGLGVTDNSEGNGGNNSHTVDNLGCRDNYLVFSFDQKVVLDKAYLGYVVCDSDIKVWIGNIDGAYNQPPNLSDATLAAMGFTEVNQTTLTTARWADLNAGGFAGNVIIIAADTTDMTPEDQFKLQQLAVCTAPVADNPPDGADVARTIDEDTAYVVLAADLGFTDRDAGQTLAAVRIESLPGNGRLLLNDTAVTAGQVVSVAALNAGQLRLVPDADESGSPYASFTFSVQDSSGRFDTAPNTFVLNVNPVNDGPVANPDAKTTPEDTPATGNVLTNDTDIENDTLSVTGFSVAGLPGNFTPGQTATIAGVGTLVINADGSYTFNPAANYFGPVPVANYTVSDGRGGSTSSTLTITVTPVNDGPVANPDEKSTPEDTLATGSVLANDTDIDSPTLTVTNYTVGGQSVAAGAAAFLAEGVFTLNGDGSYTFQPAANYHGPVPVVTYTVIDGDGGTASSTLTITVTPVNDAPVGNPDTKTTPENTPATGDVLANDTDVDNDTLAVTGFSVAGLPGSFNPGQTADLPGIGTLVINADGSYTFTPAANYNGPVPVATYQIADGQGGTGSSTLTIRVAPVNDGPVANPDEKSTPEDTLATGTVLANDTDIDSPTLTVTGYTVAGQSLAAGASATLAEGVFTLNGDGSYTFQPAANYNGPVPVVTYTVIDGDGGSASSTLTITVTPVNDAPTAAPDTKSTPEDTPATGNVLTNDTDVENDGLVVTGFSVAGLPGSFTPGQTATIANIGTLVINVDGSYTFNPAADYSGPVPVATYDISDGQGGTASSTLTITVTPANDGPVANPDEKTTLEDTPATGNVLTNDSDPDSPTLTVTSFTVAGLPDNFGAGQTATITGVGTLVINVDGSYTFNPAANYNGPVPVATYAITDGQGGSASSTLTITVTPVNDAPSAAPDTKSTPEDTPATGNVLTNDTDVENDGLVVTGFSVAGLPGSFTPGQTATIANIGTLVINVDGSYTFNPAANYSGPVPVATYDISDGQGGTASSTLTITVTPVNDPPVGNPDTNRGLEGETLTGNVLTNDSDIDLDTLTVVSFSLPGLGSFAAGTGAVIPDIGQLTIRVDGSYTFVPAGGYFGPVPVATYTLTDGQAEATSTLTLSLSAGNRAPTIGTVAVSLSEEGLPSGLADTTGTPDTTNAITLSGSLVVADAENDPVTVTLQAPTLDYTSGGTVIIWTGSGTDTLVGRADGVEILRASLAGGGYTVTVSGPIDHPVAGVEDAITVALGLRASDGQASTTALLNVTLEDDAPATVNLTQTVPDGTQRANVMLVLDVSGSMSDDSGVFDAALGRTLSRLELQQQAVEQLLAAYDTQGDVRVRIVAFSSNADAVGGEWTDVATARTLLAGIAAGGFTNYDEALTDAVEAFNSAGKLELAQNVTYFLSDGNPNTPDGLNFGTADDGIQLDEENAWRAFLDSNGMNSFALGLGGGVTQSNLDPVAYDGAGGDNTDGIVVTNLAQLADVLTGTVENASTGRLGQAGGGGSSAFGADGGRVLSVTVDGSTYTYNPANGGSISVTGTDASRFDSATNALRIQANSGATFLVDMDDGTYRYAVPQQTIAGIESIGFVLVDGDGDTANGTLTLQGSPGGGGIQGGGETGTDVFRWTLADAGSPGQPSQLQATGYDASNDKLDLHDLLQGESLAGGGVGNLENFLSFLDGPSGTQVLVSSRGGFSGGDFASAAHDATISLNSNLVAGLGLAAGANDAQILASLLQSGKLVVDPV